MPKAEPKESKKNTTSLTFFQSALTGSVAGAAEVLINHPLWSIKTRLQRGASITFQPLVLYRGIIPNAISMVPCTAIQMGLNHTFLGMVENSNLIKPSSFTRLSCAFTAGFGSAVVSCPTEMIMTYQNEHGMRFSEAASTLIKRNGFSGLFSGIQATALREGMFSAFFLGVTPIIKQHIHPYFDNTDTASFISGAIAGIGATLASQCFDTIKTIQQTSKEGSVLSVSRTFQQIYTQKGMAALFRGGIARGSRVVSAVGIMGLVKDKIEQQIAKAGL